MANSKILTAEQERALRQPIDEYVGGIQKEIDALRKDLSLIHICEALLQINFVTELFKLAKEKRFFHGKWIS